MEPLFLNNYWLAFYGWILYTVLMFVFTKDQYDDADQHFNYKQYLHKNWDNWLLSLIFVPVMAYYASGIWGGIMDWQEKDWAFRPVYYLGVGAIVELVYLTLLKFKTKKRFNN